MGALSGFAVVLSLVSASSSFYLPRFSLFPQSPIFHPIPFPLPLLSPQPHYFRAPYPITPPVSYLYSKPPSPVTYYSQKNDHFGGYSYETKAPDGGVSKVFYVSGPPTDIMKHNAFQKFQKTFHHFTPKLPATSQPNKGFFYSVQEEGAPLPPGFPFNSALGKPVVFPNGLIGAIPSLADQSLTSSTPQPSMDSTATTTTPGQSPATTTAAEPPTEATTTTEAEEIPESDNVQNSSTVEPETVTDASEAPTESPTTTEAPSNESGDSSEEDDSSSSSSSSSEEGNE